jgi:hypothetical protein
VALIRVTVSWGRATTRESVEQADRLALRESATSACKEKPILGKVLWEFRIRALAWRGRLIQAPAWRGRLIQASVYRDHPFRIME